MLRLLMWLVELAIIWGSLSFLWKKAKYWLGRWRARRGYNVMGRKPDHEFHDPSEL